MGFPSNDSGLSLAAVIKWICIIVSLPFFVNAFNGIVHKQGATGGPRSVGMPLEGADAVKWGLLNLLYAVLCLVAAWLIWRFWQQNED